MRGIEHPFAKKKQMSSSGNISAVEEKLNFDIPIFFLQKTVQMEERITIHIKQIVISTFYQLLSVDGFVKW